MVPLLARGKSFVIPPKSNRKVQRDFDKDAYKARHLIENFFCKLKKYRAVATATTKRRETPRHNPTSRLLSLAQLRTGSSRYYRDDETVVRIIWHTRRKAWKNGPVQYIT